MALITQANYLLTTWPWASLPQFPCWENGDYNISVHLTLALRDISKIKCDNDWKCISSTLQDALVYLRWRCSRYAMESKTNMLLLKDNSPWRVFHFRDLIPWKVFRLIGQWEFFVSGTQVESWFHSPPHFWQSPSTLSRGNCCQALPSYDGLISPVEAMSTPHGWKVAYVCAQPLW